MEYVAQKSDRIGALASSLCMVHCIVTPLLFVAQSSSMSVCAQSPVWWKVVDYAFLAISFAAIFRSSQTTSIRWMPTALWTSWAFLLLVIINQGVDLVCIPGVFHYLPACAIIGLHLYNQKYCECKESQCCTSMQLGD